MAKGKGGFIGHDGLNAPDAPTGVSGTAGDTTADISFTSPSDVGGSAITSYLVADSTKTHTATGSSSPITVTGLTNDTSYTFNVWAINAFGWSVASDASASVSPQDTSSRGVFAGSDTPTTVIDYIDIATTGNATDFGDLTVARYRLSSASSSTRGVFLGGQNSSNQLDTIDYITMSSTGNATDFGDISGTGGRIQGTGTSNDTRGLIAGGYEGSTIGGGSVVSDIQYITIATTGDTTDFGDLSQPGVTSGRLSNLSSASSTSRAVFMGGQGNNAEDIIQYVTIATTGNTSDFGDLTVARWAEDVGTSSNTRALCGGGRSTSLDADVNTIDYITIASTGNATDFGDITYANTREACATSNSLRAVWAGGYSSGNVIQYVTITTLGNTADFGDLTESRYGLAACSPSHGGIA